MRAPSLIALTLSLALFACAQPSGAPAKDNTSAANAIGLQGVAEDRDLAAVNKLLTYFNASTGEWTTPTGEAWQPALGIDAVINTYQRTKDSRFLSVIEKSFSRYNGRRSYYFDDDGWYLNAWIRAFDVTGQSKYLDEARSIFGNFTTAWDGTCGGGVWWNKDRNYKNAITNELFLLAAARLHRRAPNGTGAGSYYDWAFKEWNWFKNSGMINGAKLVNDGLTAGCQNNNGTTWTYNQGVILGGLVELYRIGNDRGYLFNAEQIAEATINGQSPNGVLREPCETGTCDGDQKVFKGIFAQGLSRLYNADRGNKPSYGTYLNNNANSLWNSSRDSGNGLGLKWAGPVSGVDQATQASGALLVGEVALLNAGGETVTPPAYTPGTGSSYEAELGVLHDLGTESTYAGYSGTGYLAGWNRDGQWVDFTVNVPSARTYTVQFRYAAGAGNASRLVFANGSDRVANQVFAGTGGWGSYATVSVNIALNAGSNTISLIYSSGKGSSNWLNLDKIDVN